MSTNLSRNPTDEIDEKKVIEKVVGRKNATRKQDIRLAGAIRQTSVGVTATRGIRSKSAYRQPSLIKIETSKLSGVLEAGQAGATSRDFEDKLWRLETTKRKQSGESSQGGSDDRAKSTEINNGSPRRNRLTMPAGLYPRRPSHPNSKIPPKPLSLRMSKSEPTTQPHTGVKMVNMIRFRLRGLIHIGRAISCWAASDYPDMLEYLTLDQDPTEPVKFDYSNYKVHFASGIPSAEFEILPVQVSPLSAEDELRHQCILLQQKLDEMVMKSRSQSRGLPPSMLPSAAAGRKASTAKLNNRSDAATKMWLSKRIWVGSLHKDISDQELLEAFQPYGARKSNIVRKQGESKDGCFYGFVQFDTPENKQKVLALKNKELKIKGHKIVIGDCRSEQEKETLYVEQQLRRDRCIWIGNVPKDATDEEVLAAFKHVGAVGIKIKTGTVETCNYGFVEFPSMEEAAIAQAELNSLDEIKIRGETIVTSYQPKKERTRSTALSMTIDRSMSQARTPSTTEFLSAGAIRNMSIDGYGAKLSPPRRVAGHGRELRTLSTVMNSRYSRARAPSTGMPALPERSRTQSTIGETIFDQIMSEMITDPDHEDVAKRLREMSKGGPIVHGVDLRTWKGRKGTTFLHEFAKRGNTAACEILVKLGTDINRTRDDLCTALHMAAFGKKMDTVDSLIMMGADETFQNKWGESCRKLVDKAREDLGRVRTNSSANGEPSTQD